MNHEHLNLNPDDYLSDEDINLLYGEFEEEGSASTTDAGPSSSTPGSNTKRKKKSIVWDCFDPVMQTMADGRQVEHACCLMKVESQIANIREALGWIMASNQIIAEFARFYKSKNLKPHKFPTDMPVRWNSTYLMLKSALPYALEFTCFYNLNTSNDTQYEKLTEGDWHRHNDNTARPTLPQQQSQQQSKLIRIFLNKTTTCRASGSSSQSQSQRVELNKYLSTEYSITDNDYFTINDLQKWWQNKRNNFPILLRLACDVLVIPDSTVSSEQVFSIAGRIIEDRRCSLAPDAVEALTCLKD
ncbi:hypothetical protein Ddye_020886 [Dipteronia dyeriana]|uniref:HAT C-terminal dimerisation domain-containing protein n=1 Tax=Dipteronia dyeriana TaxID=168575 RepID=A0AAD9WWF4_9ROSI|nr:hypothetical protein Ddye_020886 [Dipteronia dyeriana]